MAIEYNNDFKKFRDDDVIALSGQVYKFNDFKSKITSGLNNFLNTQDSGAAFYGISEKLNKFGITITRQDCFALCSNGTNAEFLKVASNSGWKTGKLKIKLTLEFIPDEPEISEYESPLDDIRNDPSFPNPET